jgi:hypothetical protein
MLNQAGIKLDIGAMPYQRLTLRIDFGSMQRVA